MQDARGKPFAADGQRTIAVRIETLGDLFDAFDAAPLRERGLDERLVSWLVQHAGRPDASDRMVLACHVTPEVLAVLQRNGVDLAPTLARQFERRQAELARGTAEAMRRGWWYLALGMAILTVCMVLGYLGRTYAFREPYGTFVEQALSVFSWVANWRPAEILLYERLNARARMAALARLAGAEVRMNVAAPA